VLDPLGEFNELQTLVRGVLAPEYLLDYLRYFVLFEDDGALVKKIAGYHQFHAVRSAIGQVVAASRPGGSQKGGVVWHTQGSGKSITMTCFAARVMQDSAMENPTIVVITDRNDLDGQLFGVFSLAQDLLREQPVQAGTRQDLRAKLVRRPSGGIVFATIQKFMPGAGMGAYAGGDVRIARPGDLLGRLAVQLARDQGFDHLVDLQGRLQGHTHEPWLAE
jgi:type I restriction enzyme R subunit